MKARYLKYIGEPGLVRPNFYPNQLYPVYNSGGQDFILSCDGLISWNNTDYVDTEDWIKEHLDIWELINIYS